MVTKVYGADVATITGGSIDEAVIGANTPAAGSFTTLDATGAVIFNEAGADVDFRVEGDTDANLLFIDAGNDRVGIGTSSPNARLEVKGTLPGSIGGFASGTFHVTNESATQYAGSVITGHSSYNTNTQLWYLGSSSSGNDDVALINRQSGKLTFYTNNLLRMAITSGGYLTLGSTAPAIMMKKLTGTTDADTATSVAHGLTASKILSYSVLIAVGATFLPPDFDAIANPNYYTSYITANNIELSNVQANAQNSAYKILITYEE